jgi:ribonuclease HI
VDAGTNAGIEMPGPACTMDRADGDDPLQPLCHGVPESFKEMSENMITIYFDGLCRPKNPGGVATYGYLIYRDGKKVNSEYSALKQASEWVSHQGDDEEVVIKGDSQLVINQMNSTWQIKSATSKKFVPEIHRLLEGRKIQYIWIPREQNVEADELSNLAYDEQQT